MKKRIVLITVAILCLSSFTVQAGIRIGVKAGVNLAKASFDESTIKTDNFTGFQIGPIVELSALGLGFDAAILYSQTGMKVKETKLNESMGSLLVPVNLKMKFSLAGLAGAYVAAGPYASFKLSTPEKLKTAFETKDFGAGLNFGAGVELISKLQIGVNYQMPLTNDFSSISVGSVIKSYKGKTQVWSITAAYFF